MHSLSRPLFGLLLGLFYAAAALAAGADLEREQRIHNQIVDAIFDGEPLTLSADGHDFLAIHMQSDAEPKKGAAIILHGRGLHPNWETVVQPLRVALPESGWDTLAIQMPVLEKEAKYFDYVPIFPEAYPRIEAAIAYLKEQGVDTIVLIAHSCGAHMAMNWIGEHGDQAIAAYVGIGMGATDYKQPMVEPFPLDRMAIPVLDVYGSKDYPAVLRMAPERRALIEKAGNPQSGQQVIEGAEHYFNGHNDALVETISNWLNGLKF
jgi:pimeloyl-ACP methyl ester carboxylesterase